VEIIKLNKSNKAEIIKKAVEVLGNGGVVIYPTETCYGIGVDATNQEAVDKVFKYKSRREGKPLSVAVANLEMARKYVDVNEIALNLYNNFLPGPLTVVSKGIGKVANGVESELKTLGIRIPDYDLILQIVDMLGRPVTSTSANASYKKRPYALQDILDNISEKQKNLVDLIIDAGELPKNDPSTVVDTTLNDKQVLRQGGIKLSKKKQIGVESPKQTQKFGFDLMKSYMQHLGYKSVVFAMKGELGAGKTEMTKGIASALGVREFYFFSYLHYRI
jgi:L-threonylcarbamoyladenylate synthase